MTRQQIEAKFKNKYLMINFPKSITIKNVRLGPLPTVELSAAYKVTQRRADAIVKDGDTIIIIETKIRKFAEAIGKLKEYKMLFYETPELTEWHGFPVRLRMVVPIADINSQRLAEVEDIEYDVFADPETLTAIARKY